MSQVNKHNKWFMGAAVVVSIALLYVFCTKDNPTSLPYEDDTDTWTMTIDALDGLTGDPIQATVKYTDRKGTEVIDTTDEDGHIAISGNAAGQQSFSVAYFDGGAEETAKKTASSPTAYTQVVINEENGSPEGNDDVLDKHARLPDKSAVVKLFPLTGALSGTVKTKVNKLRAPADAEDVVVFISYDNPDMENATPKTFQTTTDDDGEFSFEDLPVAPGLVVEVASKTINDIDFSTDDFAQPKLVEGQTIPVGTILMSPANGNQFALLTTAKSIVIGVNDPIVLKFTDDVDTLSTVTLENNQAGGAIAVEVKISKKTITIDPAVTLTDGNNYVLRAYVSGAKGGDLTVLEVAVTAQGGGLGDVVASNLLDANKQAIGGFGLTQALWFQFRDSVTSATATVTNGNSVVEVAVTLSEDTVTVAPVGSWPASASNLTIRISANLKDGTAATMTLTGVATTAGIALVASNVMDQKWNGVDGLGYNQPITIKINKSIKDATASLTGPNGNNVPVTVKVTYDVVTITPNENLETGKSYTLSYTISTPDNQVESRTVDFKTAASRAYVVASNVLGPDGFGLQNVAVDVSPWYKLSDTVSSENLIVTITNTNTQEKIQTVTTVNDDTVKVDPVKNLDYATAYSVKLIGKTSGGELFEIDLTSQTKLFNTSQETYVVASNVLTADGLGLKNVDETTTLWFKLSDTPSSDNLEVTLSPFVNVVVTVVGDTVKVDPTSNLPSGQSYWVLITGKTTEGQKFDIEISPAFKTRLPVYYIATNTMDASMSDNAVNFPYYGEMWVKFSEDLDTDMNKITWTAGSGTTLYGNPNSDNYNSTARISGDTLFVTPNPALVNIAYGGLAGFTVNVTTVSGRTSGFMNFSVYYMESDLYVIWTNTKNIDGSRIETFGIQDTVILVSSKKLSKVTNVTTGDLGGGIPPDITLDNIRLSASGDTIRYIPSVNMATNTTYSIDFDVKRDDGITTGTTGVLDVTWRTAEGVRILSTNNRKDGLFRPFKVIGDSLVVEFSKSIDVNKTFRVNGFVPKYTVTWSNSNKKATIKNIDTLTAGGFAPLPYTDNAATRIYNNLDFNVTTTDGETQATLAPSGDNLDIHVEQGLWVASASYIDKTDAASPVSTANGSAVETIAPDANLTVVFSRALDTNAIKADAANLYHNILTLHKHSATVLLEFGLTFSAGATTMTINPKQDLENGAVYAVSFLDIPAGLGSMNNFAGAGDGDKSLITNRDFEVVPLEIVDISDLQCALILESDIGYSPDAASYAGDAADNTMVIKIKQPAWNVSHQDSVTHYQFRYRKQGSVSWYIDAELQAGIDYSTFKSPTQLAEDEWVEAGVVIDAPYRNISYMLVADKDGAGTDYTNGNHWLNSGAVVELQARAVYDSDGNGSLADGVQSFGKWSSLVSFQDNIAPGDATFGIAGVTKADDRDMNGTTGDAINWDNFIANDSTVGMVITFPEDMDVSYATTPDITFYNALGNSETRPVKVASASRWISGRRYLLGIKLTAGTNYNDEVEFSEMAEGSTDNWTLNTGAYEFDFDGFAGTGPNSVTIDAGIYNGAKVMGTKLTANGFYSEGATNMTGAAYNIGGATPNQGTYILQSDAFDVENYTADNVVLEFRTVYDLEAGDRVDLEGDLNGDGTFESLLASYTGTQYTTWSLKQINLNAARNNDDVKIRFRVRADASSSESTGRGFFVDNLRVRYVNSNSWYYSINVGGLKDASSVTCQNSGSVGDAADDKAMSAVVGAVTGNRNVGGLKMCQ